MDAAVDNAKVKAAPFKPLPFKGPDVSVERKADGTWYLRSNHPPAEGPRSIPHLLAERARQHPDRPFLLQRAPGEGPWRGVTYEETRRGADGVAQWLLDRGVGDGDAVAVLSGNSVEHGLVMLGCYAAGAVVAPISPAYSLVATDHAKLKHCMGVVRPKVVFAQDSGAFAKAFATLRALDPSLTFVTVDGGDGTTPLSDLTGTAPREDVDRARERLGADTVSKILFTSGSTGTPKGVIQTQGMFSAQIAATEGMRSSDPVEEVPQTLQWMPWSHITAGNIVFHEAIWRGATYYLDDGKPVPGQFDETLRNLAEVSPATFGSAPVTFSILAEAMERDPALRRSFFRRLESLAYGGATLSDDINERMQALAVAETGFRIPFWTMYGATETHGITAVHWASERVGLIGLPLPGVTLKLAPSGAKLEVRVKGPMVSPGYYGDPEKSAAAFDEEGFYKLGDACRFLDPDDPSQGLAFDGRVTEDFKLSTGTWVSVGTLRPDLLTACSPYVFDAVIAGQDAPFAAALVWPSPGLLPTLGDNPLGKLLEILTKRISAFNAAAGGSSRRIGRVLIMTEPPSLDAGEITDKGYVNQRAVLTRRAELVKALYADPPGAGVVVVPGSA
jgi:feruloyl-CoA synthase